MLHTFQSRQTDSLKHSFEKKAVPISIIVVVSACDRNFGGAFLEVCNSSSGNDGDGDTAGRTKFLYICLKKMCFNIIILLAT